VPAGTPQVDRGHEACWLADRCPDGPARNAARQLPAVSSRRFPLRGIGPASGPWRDRGRTARTGPAVPVPGSPGNLWRGCERWSCRSDFQGGTVSGACPAGGVRPSAAAGRWRSGVPGRVQDGSGTMRCSRTQLDLMGHDPKPASRWPGTLRDYGRHTDGTRYSRGGKWRNSRSVAIPPGVCLPGNGSSRLAEMTSELHASTSSDAAESGDQACGRKAPAGSAAGLAVDLAVAGCRAWCSAVFPASGLISPGRVPGPVRRGSSRAVPAPRPRAGRCGAEIAAVGASSSSS
jgi:hypothetical protein